VLVYEYKSSIQTLLVSVPVGKLPAYRWLE